MNHNNIYSILGKLETLTPKEETKTEAPGLKEYADIPARGSIVEGVKTIEQTLAEKYMGYSAKAARAGKDIGKPGKAFAKIAKDAGERYGSKERGEKVAGAVLAKLRAKEGVEEAEETCAECGMYESKCSCVKEEKGQIEKTKHGIKHTKTDYPGYPADDINKDDDEDHPKDKKAGRPRKHAKKADTGEKKGRGRPKKEKAPEYDKRHDPFGRVKPGAEKSGKDIKGHKHSMDEVAPPGDKAERMVKHIKKSYSKDGKLTPKEKSIAYATAWKAHNRGTVEENLVQVQRRLTEGVNLMELLKEKQQTVDEMLAELSNDIKVFKETGHCSELLRDCMEIKGYHGKMVADEAAQVPSNPDPFHAVKPEPKGIPGNLPPKQVPGKERLLKGKGPEFFGTGRPVDEELALEDELNELAKLAGLDEVSRGEYIKQQDAAAEKSGKNSFKAFGQTFDTDEVNEEPNEGNAFTGKLKDTPKGGEFELDGKKYKDTSSLDEEELEEDKIDVADAPDAVNKPKPKYSTLKQITTQGDDLNRQKKQFADKPKAGDNPMATLEAKLAEEYESIKKVN